MMNRINEYQNRQSSLRLLVSANYHHRMAEIFLRIQLVLALLACAGTVAAVSLVELRSFMALGGMIVAVVIFTVGVLRTGAIGKAIRCQEVFDRDLFGLNLKESPDMVLADIGSRPGSDLEDYVNWYSDVSKLPVGHAILVCQRENLNWDMRVRMRFANVAFAGCVVWILIGMIIYGLLDGSVRSYVLGWVVPSVGFLLLLGHIFERNLASHRARSVIFAELQQRLATLPAVVRVDGCVDVPKSECETFQERIRSCRLIAGRVPRGFYRFTQERDQKYSAAATEQIVARLLGT
jgi:hypothetical protein